MPNDHLPPTLMAEDDLLRMQSPAESIVVLAQRIVGRDLALDSIQMPRAPEREPLILRGTLRRPSHEVFDDWLAAFNRRGYTPFLRSGDETAGEQATSSGAVGDHVELQIVPGIVPRTPSNPWINLLLFVVTLISTLLVGATYGDLDVDPSIGLGELFWLILTTPELLWSGIAFAGPLLAILTAHEFGHYFAARYHKVHVTLPYFIPMPLGFGTLGAFIRLKEPVPDQRKLFDIGVAGPLAGLILAVPLFIIGLRGSPVQAMDLFDGGEGYILGNSLFSYWTTIVTFGRALPDPVTGEDVVLNSLGFAAWIGLLVTALNLLPLGQLDGGHTVFALFGKRARVINGVTMIGMALLGIAGLGFVQNYFPPLVSVGWAGWFVWLILINVLGGPFHPPALDDVTQLDPKRRWLGYLVIAIFLLTFVPVPLRPL